VSVPQQLLDILACPRCKGPVALAADGTAIDCLACALRYPVRDDIPVMLVDEARPL
jgi:uncharacterized protein YbaR (Trm112 family)